MQCSNIVRGLQLWKAETHYLRLWTSTMYGAVPCSLSLSTHLRTSTPLLRCCLLQNERAFRQLHSWLVRQHARRHHYLRNIQEAPHFLPWDFYTKKKSRLGRKSCALNNAFPFFWSLRLFSSFPRIMTFFQRKITSRVKIKWLFFKDEEFCM